MEVKPPSTSSVPPGYKQTEVGVTCNPREHRIWLNLELAKKPLECLEYLIVHELMHLLEPTHNDRFIGLVDKHPPPGVPAAISSTRSRWPTRRGATKS